MSLSLLVISHTAHVQREGKYYGWGPTVAELNFLTTKFDQIVHIAPVHDFANYIPLSFTEVNPVVRMVPVLNRGGTTILAKFRVLKDSFNYLLLILKELKSDTELIHVRCPANISLIALIILIFFPSKRKWIKYAGDWKPRKDFISYKIQRFIIRNLLSNHIATVNGYYPDEKSFIYHFLNPSFNLEEVKKASQLGALKTLPDDFFYLIFVGALEKNKGVDIAIETFRLLTRQHKGQLNIIGDGSEMDNLRRMVVDLGLNETVCFLGWKNREEIKFFYEQAHFIILPSQGEGWPKVISEGMAYGVIPFVSDVSSIKSVLQDIGIGKVISDYSARSYADAIQTYLANNTEWKSESSKAMNFASEFSFEIWWNKLNKYLLIND